MRHVGNDLNTYIVTSVGLLSSIWSLRLPFDLFLFFSFCDFCLVSFGVISCDAIFFSFFFFGRALASVLLPRKMTMTFLTNLFLYADLPHHIHNLRYICILQSIFTKPLLQFHKDFQSGFNYYHHVKLWTVYQKALPGQFVESYEIWPRKQRSPSKADRSSNCVQTNRACCRQRKKMHTMFLHFFFQFFFLLMFVSCVIIAPSVHKKYNKKCIFCVCEGTNGKGSVAFKIARALREAGYKDGLFVSPHVSSFRERMQVCVYYRHLYF
jgi:hypothetical protein